MQLVRHDASEVAELLPGDGASAQGQGLLHTQLVPFPCLQAMSRDVTPSSWKQPAASGGARGHQTGIALLRGGAGVGRTANKFLQDCGAPKAPSDELSASHLITPLPLCPRGVGHCQERPATCVGPAVYHSVSECCSELLKGPKSLWQVI